MNEYAQPTNTKHDVEVLRNTEASDQFQLLRDSQNSDISLPAFSHFTHS